MCTGISTPSAFNRLRPLNMPVLVPVRVGAQADGSLSIAARCCCYCRGGAIVIEGAEGTTIANCSFVRLGGNAIALTGHAWHTTITESEFFKIGDSAIVSVGDFKLNDGVSSDAYPLGTMITGNHFHEIGVTGKQTSALFSATSCRSTFRGNVAYNGPRAGERIYKSHFVFFRGSWYPHTSNVELPAFTLSLQRALVLVGLIRDQSERRVLSRPHHRAQPTVQYVSQTKPTIDTWETLTVFAESLPKLRC